MNYYIQGNAAKAKQIKAAFEEKGYKNDVIWNFDDKGMLYFTVDGDNIIKGVQCEYGQHIIKTHPDYQELELPVEPKFKKGDWIACDADSFTLSIKSVKDGNYFFHQGTSLPIKNIDEHYHLWTIQDAKDGDVLVVNGSSKQYKWIGIFKAHTSDTLFSSHCHYNCGMYEFVTHITRCTNHGTGKYSDIRPATNEECDLLFKKMKEAGYEWDAEKKELHKIQPHYDIDNFKPKQWVLVRDDDEWEWALTRFSHFSNGSASLFVCINGASFQQCIPYEGNEHLLGTTDKSSEDRKNLAKEVIERCVSTEPPIEESPYINVVFCKGNNGWIPFTGYGCDISPKKTVEFINCINDAADVLNRKEE